MGTWKTVDDETGESKSHIEIYEKEGVFYGKVAKILVADPKEICTACEGDKKEKPMLGLEIIEGMKPYRKYWSYGTILDPESGKVYKCNLSLKGSDKLQVRGYIGVAALGRTQVWERVK